MQNLASKILCIFVTRAYAPCLSTPLYNIVLKNQLIRLRTLHGRSIWSNDTPSENYEQSVLLQFDGEEWVA